MDLYCTRPGCPKPINHFADLDDPATLKGVPQKYCTTCGMQLILLGRYLPLKLLGQGGFGVAVLARDRYTPGMRQCVVKQFLPSGNLTPTQLTLAQELFEREAEVLENLGNAHPQIPDLFAFFDLTVPSLQTGKQDQLFYLVQEFIDGETLEEELVQKGHLSPDEVLEMLEQILPVLKFVHEHGTIHRDIKPSNIMRHRNGQYYLLDFGAVKLATKGGGAGKSTGIYSVGFAPPEQVHGDQVFPSTDLYALAVTCVLMLTGKPYEELLDAYSNTWNWRSHTTQIPDSLAAILDRMLLSTPSLRFQSAEEVLQALQQPQHSTRRPPFPSARSPRATPPSSSRVAPPRPHTPNPTQAPNIQTPPISPSPHSPTPPSVPATPPRPKPAIAPFSTLELLIGAGFTGFEGGLLAIALVSFLGTSLISAGAWLVLLAGLVIFQARRVIERVDLLIIAAISLTTLLVLVSRSLVGLPTAGNPVLTVVVIAVLTGLGAIALTALFRLIYKILSTFL